MRLYRAVSQDELVDIRTSGSFRCSEGTLEVKWFAEELAGAREWARRFAATDGKIYAVVEVVLVDAPPSHQRRSNVDGVGPACWLELEQVRGVVIREVMP